jgi:carbamate kinase
MPEKIVLAFGGNAITKAKEKGTRDEQWHNIQGTCHYIVDLVKAGHSILITHGNGPQVGNLLLKNECAKEVVPPMPLDVCVSNTQGSIGYALCQNLGNALSEAKLAVSVAALITQVVVRADDEAFTYPTKFIGPFFSETEAKRIMTEKQQILREDSGRGWRRVVPSPQPQKIIEAGVIKQLLASGSIVVAAGGAGRLCGRGSCD